MPKDEDNPLLVAKQLLAIARGEKSAAPSVLPVRKREVLLAEEVERLTNECITLQRLVRAADPTQRSVLDTEFINVLNELAAATAEIGHLQEQLRLAKEANCAKSRKD